jgi:hypothetical protein
MPHTAHHTDYMAGKIGTARLAAGYGEAFEAGSFQSFELSFAAGQFGMDDTGSIRIVHRFASDMGTPQFDDPGAPTAAVMADWIGHGPGRSGWVSRSSISSPPPRPERPTSSGGTSGQLTAACRRSSTPAYTVRRHWDGILQWCHSKVANGSARRRQLLDQRPLELCERPKYGDGKEQTDSYCLCCWSFFSGGAAGCCWLPARSAISRSAATSACGTTSGFFGSFDI